MRNWKFSISSADTAPASAPILLTGDVCNNLKLASELGYNGLEVHTRETASINYKEVNRIAKAYGMEISAIVTGRLNTEGQVNLIDDRPYITQAAIQGMYEYIEMASKLHTNLIIGWVKGKIPEGGQQDKYLERLAYNLSIICERAAEKNVKIFMEVINRYEVNVFTSALETITFLDMWDISNCYVHLDTFHMGIEELDPIEAIKLSKNRLGYFHAADNTRCYPGSGTFDFGKIMRALDEINYEGYVSVECLPVPDGMAAANRALNHLKNCMDKKEDVHESVLC